MNRSPKIADSLAVDDAHLEDALPPAGGEILWHNILYLLRFESVQIQHTVYRQWDWLLHIKIEQPASRKRRALRNSPDSRPKILRARRSCDPLAARHPHCRE